MAYGFVIVSYFYSHHIYYDIVYLSNLLGCKINKDSNKYKGPVENELSEYYNFP